MLYMNHKHSLDSFSVQETFGVLNQGLRSGLFTDRILSFTVLETEKKTSGSLSSFSD